MEKQMSSTPTVAVLMSTYNGDRYLREQVDSILAQEGVDVTLFVRDDGSTDGTLEVLDSYRGGGVIIRKGDNIGVARSFMQLVYDVPGGFDYYAFADQDDIWLPDKLEVAVLALRQSKGKCLYASNQECVDAEGRSLGLRYEPDEDVHTKTLAVLQQNMLAGCTFVFTGELKERLAVEDSRPSGELLDKRIHDVWVINVAALFDGVLYDNSSHMLYRQHADNVIGAYNDNPVRRLIGKLEKLANKGRRRGRSTLGAELCRCFPKETEGREILRACVIPSSCENKRVLLRNAQALRGYTGETHVGISLKIIFGLF